MAVGSLSTTGVNKLALTAANALVNRGGFGVETATTLQAIAVPVDGTYAIDFTLYMSDSTASTRSEIRAELVVIRGAAEATDLRTPFARYYRDNAATDEFYISGSMTLDLVADDQLQLLISEITNTVATFSTGANNSKISVARLVGSGGSGNQVAGGFTETTIVGSRLATTEYGLGTVWTSVIDAISPTFSPIDPDNMDRIEIGFRVDSAYVVPLTITGRMLDEIGPAGTSPIAVGVVPGAYYSGRPVTGADAREPVVINPQLAFMEARRQANRHGILMAFPQNGSGSWVGIRIFVSAAVEIDIEYAYAYST